MRRAAIAYSEAEMRWLEENRLMVISEYHVAFVERFGRSDVSLQNLHGLRKRKGWKTGRTGHFPKGHVPENKGKKGYHAPGSEKGWFKKGERQGVATKLYKPIGSERVSESGYLERKINDDMPLQARWRAVHLIRWEEQNGPIPEGHALKCLDGDKSNTDPSNWKRVPRAMLPRLNGRFGRGYDNAPAELKPTILAIAELEHAARSAKQRDESS